MAGLRALLESRASPEENNRKGKMWAYSNVAIIPYRLFLLDHLVQEQ